MYQKSVNKYITILDNLYLDVNGVIHKRAHNNSVITMCRERLQEDIFYDIFCYIDELVHLIKPRKTLMISADGVAPRAKMNQQRTRRFRKTDTDPKELESLRRQGLDPEKMFDSNSISAGTEFMFELSKAFDVFVKEKIQSDSLWKGLKVIVTGSDVPGEGEHKIIEYIRNFKNSDEYSPDFKHCLYGLDADLIMLSLITHEPNICILREDAFSVKKSASDSTQRDTIKIKEPFEFIYVSVLREYLELEFLEIKTKLKVEYNIERIIDDFIFFCFFIGNDFLPNLNTLDIDHGALDQIFMYYKEVLPTIDDYITYHGKIDFKKAEKIFAYLANQEMTTLQKKLKDVEKECAERNKKKQRAMEDRKKLLKMQKLMARKEKFLLDLKTKDELFITNYKLNKIKKKINDYRSKYEEEMLKKGKIKGTFKFEEDVENYLKDQLNKKIAEIKAKEEKKEDLNNELSLYQSDSVSSIASGESSDINGNKKQQKIEPKEPLLENPRGLVSLFDSDDEDGKPKGSKPEEKKEIVIDRLTDIFKDASKYQRYIQDDKYCSDINIDDIDENDVGNISDPEVTPDEIFETKYKEYAENQDLDKVFQKKLLDLYITDVNKAKAFYYKEKLKIDLDTPQGEEEHKNIFRKYLEGLQWVLYYYYRGIQSWRWYYPYHYAPMISEFNKIKDFLDYDLDNTFKYVEPFSPYESLLFILPKKSRQLIPKCYWGIFEDLIELYPNKFDIDFNGKRMPWESIVLIPFLPENVILNYEQKQRLKYSKENEMNLTEQERELILTDRELERNCHGKSYLYQFDKINNNINREIYEVYMNIQVTDLSSNYNKKNVAYSFPTLKTINYNYTFDLRKQYAKSVVSKKLRVICLRPILNTGLLNEMNLKSFLLNGSIFINYPFKQEAILRGIYINNQYLYLDYYGKVQIDNKMRLPSDIREILRRDWNKKGVIIDYCSVLCNVSLMKRLIRNNDGSIDKLYDDNYAFYVPFEITSLNSHLEDFNKIIENYKNFKKSYSKIENEFVKTEPTLVLSKNSYGCLGRVSNYIKKNNPDFNKHNEDNYSIHYDIDHNFDLENKDWEVALDRLYSGTLVEVEVKNIYQTSFVTDPLFAKNIIKKTNEEYITMNDLAKKLNISIWSLGLLTSSLFVVNCTNDEDIDEDAKISSLEHWNIGLNLKTKSKFSKLILPGYTRYIEDPYNYGEAFCWEFSKLAVDLIYEYQSKFPFVFQCLEKYRNLYNRSNKFFRIYELFSTIDDIQSRITEVAIWINANEVNQAVFTNHKSNFLSKRDCQKIEEYVNNKNIISNENQVTNNLICNTLVLNPNYIYQESYPWIPPFMAYEPNAFQLGDRVVNIRSNDYSYIPFGLKGTVTGVSLDFLEIMFDSEFFGGSNLNFRLTSKRGAYVKPYNLINLTCKTPIYLRRNGNKYDHWNFEYTYNNYEGVYGQAYALAKPIKEKENSKNRKESDQVFKKDSNIDLDKQYSSDNRQKDTEHAKVNVNKPKIIQKDDYSNAMLNNNNNNNNVSNTETPLVQNSNSQNLYNTSNSYIPKKIITRDGPKINSNSFKTYQEGVKVTSETNIVEITQANQSEYRNNRKFTNENLKHNQLYYYPSNYTPSNVINIITNNNNIIVKQLELQENK